MHILTCNNEQSTEKESVVLCFTYAHTTYNMWQVGKKVGVVLEVEHLLGC